MAFGVGMSLVRVDPMTNLCSSACPLVSRTPVTHKKTVAWAVQKYQLNELNDVKWTKPLKHETVL